MAGMSFSHFFSGKVGPVAIFFVSTTENGGECFLTLLATCTLFRQHVCKRVYRTLTYSQVQTSKCILFGCSLVDQPHCGNGILKYRLTRI